MRSTSMGFFSVPLDALRRKPAVNGNKPEMNIPVSVMTKLIPIIREETK